MIPDEIRQPPHSLEAEQAVLGGIMIDPGALAKISAWISEADFYRNDHQVLFRCLKQMREEDQALDAVTVNEWLETAGYLARLGGPSFVYEMVAATASAANVEAYAEIVREKRMLRDAIEIGHDLTTEAFRPAGKTARDLCAVSMERLSVLSASASPRAGVTIDAAGVLWYQELSERFEGKRSRGLLTPWSGVNRFFALEPAMLIVLAARPSMGKTAAALGAIGANALRGTSVLMFSLEMSREQLISRMVAAHADVELSWIKNPDDDQEKWARVTRAISAIRAAPIEIDDSAGLTAEQICLRAKRRHMRDPVGMVVIDHLHLVSLAGDNAAREIGDATGRFKNLAKALKCPVVLLSQLNRKLEDRPNKRPVMSDLRDSGTIEQDADVIVFLYRDDYYAEQVSRESEYPGMVEFIVSKNRDGATGKAWGRSALDRGRIDDTSEDDPAPRPRKAKPAPAFDAKARSAGDEAPSLL